MRAVCVVGFLFFASWLSAQGCCSSVPPAMGQSQFGTLQKHMLRTSLSFRYHRLGDARRETKSLSVQDRERTISSISTKLQWQISDRSAVLLSIPYQFIREKTSAGASELSLNGVGDAVALYSYQLGKVRMMAGGRLPTGQRNLTAPNTPSIPLHPDLQPGTGSVEMMLGGQVDLHPFKNPQSGISASILWAEPFESNRLGGRQTYEFGTRLQTTVSFYSQVLVLKQLFHPSVSIQSEWQAPARINSIEDPFSGGFAVHAQAALGWEITPVFRLQAWTLIPFYKYADGIQLTTSFQAGLSISRSFQLGEP